MKSQWCAVLLLSMYAANVLAQEVCPQCKPEHVQDKFCRANMVITVRIIKIEVHVLTVQVEDVFKGTVTVDQVILVKVEQIACLTINLQIDDKLMISVLKQGVDNVLNKCSSIIEKLIDIAESVLNLLRHLAKIAHKACKCITSSDTSESAPHCSYPAEYLPCYSSHAICQRRSCHARCEWLYADQTQPTCDWVPLTNAWVNGTIDSEGLALK